MTNMIHNLKMLRRIVSAPNKFGGNFVPATNSQRFNAQTYVQRYYANTSASTPPPPPPATTIIKCWQCGSSTHSSSHAIQFQCSKCRSLLNVPDNVNHFDLFALGHHYAIDTNQLQRKFLTMQSVLHPDKFSQKSNEEQSLSAEWCSLVNKAYKVLQSPIQRAEYYLSLHQITIPEGNTAVDNAFLMEMMERNEEVDEADTKDELITLLANVRKEYADCERKLEQLLTSNDLEAAKSLVVTMRYLIRLENSIKAKGNRLGIVL